LHAVNSVVKSWNPKGQESNPWFRGHSQGSWELTPKIYRAEFKNLDEDDFRWEFYHLAWPYLSNAAWEPKSAWDWYFLMQHYGLPTRLLDWTESALVALYFALRENKDTKENPAVWILNPKALNHKIVKKGYEIMSPLGSKKIKKHLPNIDSSSLLPRYPIAIQPELKSLRIAAQQGVFTLHGKAKTSLDHYPTLQEHLVKVEILRSKNSLVKEQLLVAGIGETTVFPELSALCKELIDYYQYKA
jgi:hypothetical protein